MISKSNIKYIQSLQHKKFRDKYNCFVAEGKKLVNELLAEGLFTCNAIFAVSSWVDMMKSKLSSELLDKITIVEDFELTKIANYATPNEVVAIFEKKNSVESIDFKGKCTLVLDSIQDPGNLGTIIRTADWFGIENIICSKNTVDMYNPKVVQSTMASLGRVNVHYADIKTQLESRGQVKIFAAVLGGEPVSSNILLQESIIMIGNEANGLSIELIELADHKISIPSFGNAESLNAAIATAILLYEARRK